LSAFTFQPFGKAAIHLQLPFCCAAAFSLMRLPLSV
jgi:hypothetical protein